MAVDERTADLLSALAPPFRLKNGPDFILSQRAPGNIAGATLWLQNPTDRPMPVSFWLDFERGGDSRVIDMFRGTLAPLEVGALAVPVSIRFRRPHAVHFKVGPGKNREEWVRDAPRIREASAGHLDRDATAKGMLTGLAGLALVGVGHFTIARAGGDVGTTFSAMWTLEGADPSSVWGGAPATWTRVWAPDGAEPTTFVHEAKPQSELVVARPLMFAQWVLTFLGGALVMLALLKAGIDGLPGLMATVAAAFVVFFAAGSLFRSHFPGLHSTVVIEPLVVRDGEGVIRA